MNPETDDLTLDLERYDKIQEIINKLEQVMAAETGQRISKSATHS
jgi:hypothetical protein